MTEAKPFLPVKLIAGIISARDDCFIRAEAALTSLYGPVDRQSPRFPFDATDYYDRQMGKELGRMFVSFGPLIPPESISRIKIRTNSLEEDITDAFAGKVRLVNIDPGILTASALFMATAKDFAHRVPLQGGIYAHLEILFTRKVVRLLPWTYPDFRKEGYQAFFLAVRRIYLEQLRQLRRARR